MKYSTPLLIICTLLIPTYPVVAGEWRYDNAAATESTVPEATDTQPEAQPTSVAYAPSTAVTTVPNNNMTMQTVRAQFGQPNSEAAPIGEPPINRWFYDDYTVYFEFDRVIISVIN